MSAKFDEFPSLPFQDIKEKPKRHGRTDGKTDGQRENSIPTPPPTPTHTHKHSLRGYNKMTCVRACKDSDQLYTHWVAKDPMFLHAVKTLIRLSGCPGWTESSLGAHHFVAFVVLWLIFVKKAKITDYLWQPCTFCALTIFILLCIVGKCGKKVYSHGGGVREGPLGYNKRNFFFAS